MNGEKAENMPVHIMTHYFVFLNPKTAPAQNVNPDSVKKVAEKLHYKLQIL